MHTLRQLSTKQIDEPHRSPQFNNSVGALYLVDVFKTCTTTFASSTIRYKAYVVLRRRRIWESWEVDVVKKKDDCNCYG
ncbi:hypothetical protein PoB_006332000 [Plakobranchus ocellatus]|uniref:Uncharacterized protein n=1 Tax=Plakobranchus ocellatus TaxID=259542 RepID=A0AAV4CYC7_9GAST|nr:hypothetical protein PoB_006332000 [Plakobranchus ocellatus]